jgi:tellurite resistance protein TerC
MEISTTGWLLFNGFLLAMLALDLGVFHRKAKVIQPREALMWSGVWIGIAGIFAVFVYIWQGSQFGTEFLTGYLIEKTLSIDNVFVFVLIFSYFKVPAQYQYRVLFWGVVGALVMRGALILAGSALLSNFHWLIFVFGGFLVVSGIRMAFHDESKSDPGRNPVLRLVKKIVPTSDEYDGQKFFTRRTGMLMATPLFAVLVVVEATDLVFAVDSIPAIFAITDEPFIVYTSNALAILGLRALYFALAGVMHKFTYLKTGLSLVLVFVGVKMLASDVYHMPAYASLVVIIGILGAAVAVSLMKAKPEAEHSIELGQVSVDSPQREI